MIIIIIVVIIIITPSLLLLLLLNNDDDNHIIVVTVVVTIIIIIIIVIVVIITALQSYDDSSHSSSLIDLWLGQCTVLHTPSSTGTVNFEAAGILRSVVCYRLVGLVVKASASRAEGPGFESRMRRDFFGVESYQ